jgi:hypothetical protein
MLPALANWFFQEKLNLLVFPHFELKKKNASSSFKASARIKLIKF